MKFTVDIIAGARPNFMKVAALFAVADQFPNLHLRLIHTGQHYSANMSDTILSELNLPEPHLNLEVGSGDATWQTTEVMRRYAEVLANQPPHLCLVVGDVNSTIACALASAQKQVPIVHVEAGLRSFDRNMPEEINRVVTDQLSDLLFVTEPSGLINLSREGVPEEKMRMVGHVMIDTLVRMAERAQSLQKASELGFEKYAYAFVTLHRPSNVDDPEQLEHIIEQLTWASEKIPLLFSVHPRTRARLESSGLHEKLEKTAIKMIEPVTYLESLSLMQDARGVFTDSGGLQEETSALNVPCLTLRLNTERPITVSEGTNTIIGDDWTLFRQRVEDIANKPVETRDSQCQIPYWDGRAGVRILSHIEDYLTESQSSA